MNKQATDEFADFEVNPIDDLLTGILIRYNVIPHLTYVVANGYECKLDPWLPKTNFGERVPTLIYIHGGGWISGEREQYALTSSPLSRWASPSPTCSTAWHISPRRPPPSRTVALP